MTALEVRAGWSWIRKGLQEVIGRCAERYMAEDVWAAVMAGNAFIWKIDSAHDEIGFLVLRKENDPDGPALFLWCAYAEPGSLVKHAGELMERLKELGHRMGAKRLRFESPRKAWSFLDYFEEKSRIYEHQL
jgi:hypothetical protein